MPKVKIDNQKLGRIIEAARRRLGKYNLEGAISEAVGEVYGSGGLRQRYYVIVLKLLQREQRDQQEALLRRDVADSIKVAWERNDDLLDDESDRPGIPDKPGRDNEGFGSGWLK